MVLRCLLVVMLAVTGFMVVASPVAATIVCAHQSSASVPQDTMADYAAHAQHDRAADPAQAPDQPPPTCCDHACLIDMSTLSFVAHAALSGVRAIHPWGAADLIALTQPDGLKRPPKA
ncbi:hypothetical protein [Pseudooceanicola nanhaiensis]|uniref:hypothetical protein n=1 Tax=Pseudooceanicola nanhaiensis TaxID=375761 RepID=UPI001CD43970|nr:hypothetical protein [Pseudooceanicola nanhaiensis]MCA0920667.1 hypothetical protein [Pseudooceanicola nanhaiensis]